MQSAGNDIVALHGTNSERTNNERFYRQIVSDGEVGCWKLAVGSGQFSFERFVWLAWSVKESLFKFIKRSNPDLVFSPVKMEIKELTPPTIDSIDTAGEIDPNSLQLWSGVVEISDSCYFFKTKVTETFIASVVNNDCNFDNMYWAVRESSETDGYLSKLVRDFAREKLSGILPGKKITFSEPNGSFPVIIADGVQQENFFISFSHHCGIISYVIKVG